MLKRNLATAESREFWKHVEEVAKEVEEWPPQQRGNPVFATLTMAESSFDVYTTQFSALSDPEQPERNPEFGIYTSGGNLILTKNFKSFKKKLTDIIVSFLKQATNNSQKVKTWPLMEEAAKRTCHWSDWMRSCSVIMRVELRDHRKLLVYTLSNGLTMGVYYCPW